jgi:UDP-N-acetylglucosamine transferase subunit ALG13
MIVVTVGTNEQPFDRLVRASSELRLDEPLFVQHGSSRLPHGPGTWVDFLPYEELAERIRLARVVVCHAGVGSIMLARHFGKRPLVVPRRIALGEAVDDHQLPLARRLDSRGIVDLVEDTAALEMAIAGHLVIDSPAGPADTQSLPGAAALAADVRDHLKQFFAA